MASVYLVGVGGQGIITASKIIGEAALLESKSVVLSETHGMAQRGGSVVCTARIGDMSSPAIPDGEADVILSLELLETLRARCKASKKTIVIASKETYVPLSVSTGKLPYPSEEQVRAQFEGVCDRLVIVDSRRIAEEAGVPRSSNVVMIGALAGSGRTGIGRDVFEKALGISIRSAPEENLEAFANGFELTSGL